MPTLRWIREGTYSQLYGSGLMMVTGTEYRG